MAQSCRESGRPVRGSSGAWELAAAICLKSVRRPPHAAVLLPLAEARAWLRLAALLCRPPPPSRSTSSLPAHPLFAPFRAAAPQAARTLPPRRCLCRHGSRRVAVARPPPRIGAACVPFGLRPPPAGPTLLWTAISRRSSRQHSPSTETWAQRSPPSWWREPPPHIGSPQIKLSFAAPALCIHLLCCEDSAAVETSVAQATQLGDAFPVV
nr:unnamed protein product [Digitaria exilis]